MDEAKVKEAEVRYFFSKTKEPTALLKVEYEDGSTRRAEGQQAIEEADKLVKELKDEPIFVKPVESDNAQQVQE